MEAIPILGELTPGKTQRHLIKLPGVALANDEPRPVITVTGAKAGQRLFVNAGVHGGEYPAIEAVIRLSKALNPQKIAGTVILMPVLNLPAFRGRTPFVCPIDNVNPNRVFPGDPNGTYSEQMTHALINEFVIHANAYVDLHGGDIPESLVPFVICRASKEEIANKSREMAITFGLPYVLTVSRPVQPAKGQSSYAAAAEKGIPAILAEAGGLGQLQEDAVAILVRGVINVMRHLAMVDADAAREATAKFEIPSSKSANSKSKTKRRAHSAVTTTRRPAGDTPTTTVLTKFDWLYSENAGMWYPRIQVGDLVEEGEDIGTIGNLFGETLERIVAPVTGTVLFLTANPSVLANGLLMGIGVD